MTKSNLLVLLLLLLPLSAIAGKRKLTLINANKNANRMVDGSMTSTLTGDVQFRWGETLINSDTTIWYRKKNLLKLFGNVHIIEGNQNIYCQRATFIGKKRELHFNGGITAIDSIQETTITAENATYFLNDDSLALHKSPQVHFWSSTSSDTLTIAGRTMYYTGENQTASAVDNVTFTSTDLLGKADTAYFYAGKDKGMLIGNRPGFTYSTNHVEGDTIYTYFNKTSLESFTAIGSPFAVTSEKDDTTEVVSQLKADTLVFHLEGTHIDTITAISQAVVSRQNGSNFLEADTLWGNHIVTVIEKEKKGVSYASGNAKAIYAEEKSRNRVACDSITLYFEESGVEKIELTGAVQGIIYEEAIKEE